MLFALQGLSLAQPDNTSLFSSCSVEIDYGQAIVLGGPSGVGKSTLLRCMAGLEARALGTISWKGVQVTDKGIPDFRRQAIYVAQSAPRYPMRVQDALKAPFHFRHQDLAYSEERTSLLCEKLLLGAKLLSRRMVELSGGEAQRVALLMAFLLQPTFLLLDEPASGLDSESRQALRSLLAEWLEEGERSLIICSHEPSWCEPITTDYWTLHPGGKLEQMSA